MDSRPGLRGRRRWPRTARGSGPRSTRPAASRAWFGQLLGRHVSGAMGWQSDATAARPGAVEYADARAGRGRDAAPAPAAPASAPANRPGVVGDLRRARRRRVLRRARRLAVQRRVVHGDRVGLAGVVSRRPVSSGTAMVPRRSSSPPIRVRSRVAEPLSAAMARRSQSVRPDAPPRRDTTSQATSTVTAGRPGHRSAALRRDFHADTRRLLRVAIGL